MARVALTRARRQKSIGFRDTRKTPAEAGVGGRQAKASASFADVDRTAAEVIAELIVDRTIADAVVAAISRVGDSEAEAAEAMAPAAVVAPAAAPAAHMDVRGSRGRGKGASERVIVVLRARMKSLQF